MRRATSALAAGLLLGGFLAWPARAQQGGYPSSRVGGSYGYSGAAEPDLLSPYGTRSNAGFYDARKGYARPPAPRPAAPPPVARTAVHARGVQDYYPTLRAGGGPNRNTIDPRHLCVPGRPALIMRGR